MYEIVRFYRHDRDDEVLKVVVTEAEAREWCNRPDTKDPAGQWFDGYREQGTDDGRNLREVLAELPDEVAQLLTRSDGFGFGRRSWRP